MSTMNEIKQITLTLLGIITCVFRFERAIRRQQQPQQQRCIILTGIDKSGSAGRSFAESSRTKSLQQTVQQPTAQLWSGLQATTTTSDTSTIWYAGTLGHHNNTVVRWTNKTAVGLIRKTTVIGIWKKLYINIYAFEWILVDERQSAIFTFRTRIDKVDPEISYATWMIKL